MKRMRRGKDVEIPDEWLGQVTTDKTKRLRKQLAEEKIRLRKKRLKDLKHFDFSQEN
jgi:hypothetical protein